MLVAVKDGEIVGFGMQPITMVQPEAPQDILHV